jgi:hypothetical protein
VRLRGEASRLVAARWVPLTVATVVGHLVLYVAIVLAVRDVGISAREVSWAQVLGVFALVRLLSALPVTPGGLGIVELGYIAGLVLAGRHQTDAPMDVFHAQVAAAVLVFRALTYGLQIPIGAFAYLIWQRKKELAKNSSARTASGGRRRPRDYGLRIGNETASRNNKKGEPTEVSSPLGAACGAFRRSPGLPGRTPGRLPSWSSAGCGRRGSL